MFSKKHPRKAFSLTELSIVLLIIGIALASYIAANSIISKVRISNAQTLTQSSPVSAISGASLWLESSLDSSFSGDEADDGKSISVWFNNIPTSDKSNASQSSESQKPTYANTINRIHAVKFDGENQYFTVDGSFLNNSDYTFFVVEKRLSDKSENYFIGDPEVSTTNQNILLGYSSSGRISHLQGSSNSYGGGVLNYNSEGVKPKITTFVQDSSEGKKTYINGILSASSNNTARLSNISTLAIGKGYNGELGEIVAFNRSLDEPERQEVEEYLSQKWSVKTTSGVDCSSGTITGSGCNTAICSVSLIGSKTYLVDAGAGTLSCNETGYNGNVSYNCSGGSANLTGSCGCATGYTLFSDGTCQRDCTGIRVTGVIPTTAPAGSGSLTCDDVGYSGSASYTCLGGTFNATGSCVCASGYSMVSGLCKSDCAVAVAGVSTTSVNHGSGTLNCTVAGFSGSPLTYTCTNGSLSVTGSCAAATCTAPAGTGYNAQSGLDYAESGGGTFSCDAVGFTGTKTYTCTSAGVATSIGGACSSVTCTAPAGTGYDAQSSLPYATSGTGTFNCNAAGFSGTKTYTCTTSGVATSIGGTCSATTCTAPSGTGYDAQSALPYAESGAGVFACSSGFSGTKTYTCTTSGVATSIGGTCTAITCTAPSGTGYDAQSALPYAESGAGVFACATGFSGNKTYTCTTSGVATSIGGTCSAITCTAPAGTGYNAQSSLPYATSGTGTFNCNATGYSGNKNYTCEETGVATITGGTCVQTCSTGSTAGINTTTVNVGTGTLSCNATGYSTSDSINYSCSGGVFSLTGGTSCNVCVSGYTLFSGACHPNCTASANGILTTTVSPTNSTVKSCDEIGHHPSDTITYSCLNGVFSVISGVCDTCTSDAIWVSTLSRCRVNCYGVYGTVGMYNKVNRTYPYNYHNAPTSLSCEVPGFSGNVSYTCNSSGTTFFSNITVQSNSCAITSPVGRFVYVRASATLIKQSTYDTEYIVHGGATNNTLTCTQATNNKYAIYTGGISAQNTPSSGVWTSTNANWQVRGWAGCYCTGYTSATCSDSCTYGGGTTGSFGAVYRCVYP